MKYCELCKAKIDTNSKFCPLCHNALSLESDKDSIELFENKQKIDDKKKSEKIVTKIFAIISIIIVSVCIFINITIKTIPWSVIVTLSVLYLWVMIAHTIISRDTPFKKVLYHLIALIALLIATNIIFGGSAWLTNFVYPGLAMLVTLVLTFILFCSKNRKNMIFSFFCIIVLMLLVSLILLVFNIDTFRLLNNINLMVQCLFIVSYLIFGHKAILSEAGRKFHI